MSLRASPRRELASCQALFSRAAIFANSKHSEPWAPNWVNAVNAVEFAGLCWQRRLVYLRGDGVQKLPPGVDG